MKVAVGLSGGVDSAVAAAFLVEQGYDVTGVFLECWNESGCRTDKDRQDALAVALKLKIPFKVLDFKKEYREKVLENFYREYQAGRTPNPDVWCNREIKFGLFLEWAMKNKFDKVATGHYCQIRVGLGSAYEILSSSQLPQSRRVVAGEKFVSPAPIHLLSSVDEQKDQTYFLAMLKQKQLEKVMFPIGHLIKKQVRAEAKKKGLPVWDKKDSTGICFIGHDLSFNEFLRRKIKEHEGEVVNKKGKVVGKHKGVEFYTIGQRHGFEINSRSQTPNSKRLFVIQKDILRNRLIVGNKQDLAKKEFEVINWEWIGGGIHPQVMGKSQKTSKVRIRHQGRLIGCRIVGKKVRLEKAEYGIASGQLAVIYQKMEGTVPSEFECLGGGVIK